MVYLKKQAIDKRTGNYRKKDAGNGRQRRGELFEELPFKMRPKRGDELASAGGSKMRVY